MVRASKKGVALFTNGASEKSSNRRLEQSRIEVLSPKVQIKGSSSWTGASLIFVKAIAFPVSRPARTKPRARTKPTRALRRQSRSWIQAIKRAFRIMRAASFA